MKQIAFFIVCCIACITTQANDGSFWARGNTLFPLKETTVQLKKEILNLTKKDNWMQVDVYFEFYNSGNGKDLLVGFVTPPADGDVSDKAAGHPQIKDFTVVVNNDTLKYKISRTDKSGFRLADKQIDGQDFIYYFKVNFVQGLTKIRHSYQYRGGESISTIHGYDYRLTTGTTWANKEIEDFELNIDMGKDVFFSVPYSFNKSRTNWEIVGLGKINTVTPVLLEYYERINKLNMVYIREGKLSYKTKHFKPLSDLSINIYRPYLELNTWTEDTKQNEFKDLREYMHHFTEIDSIRKKCTYLSDYKLRLLINLPYARAGYDFKTPELKKVFSKCLWYLPDSNIQAIFKEYYYKREVFDILIAEEKRRKKQ